MRSKPLMPMTRPFDAAAKLYVSIQWLYEHDTVPENYRYDLMAQALRMLDTIYRPPVPQVCVEQYRFAVDEDLPRTLAAFKNVEIHWDAMRMIYTFADGTTLPERKQGE